MVRRHHIPSPATYDGADLVTPCDPPRDRAEQAAAATASVASVPEPARTRTVVEVPRLPPAA